MCNRIPLLDTGVPGGYAHAPLYLNALTRQGVGLQHQTGTLTELHIQLPHRSTRPVEQRLKE